MRFASVRLCLLLWLFTLLAACAGRSSREDTDVEAGAAPPEAWQQAYASRAAALQSWPSWGFSGRLGIDAGKDGGSGRIEWLVATDQSELRFRGAMGQGNWQLLLQPQSAELSKADGTVISNSSAADLLEQELGWQVPVDAWRWWVRGLAAPDSPHEFSLDIRGTPAQISQSGWTVSFQDYVEHGGQWLPQRLEAARGGYRIRLAIGRWWHGQSEKA